MEDFHKYLKIYTFGHDENKEIFKDPEDEIVIQEKIDGGNFRFMIKDDKVIFGSRTQQITDDEGNEVNVSKDFNRVVLFVRNRVEEAKKQQNIKSFKFLENFIFYGEACHKHTMSYNWEKIPPFLGFDVYDMKTNKFLDCGEAQALFASFNLEFVPIIDIVKAKDIKEINDDIVPVSRYALLSNPTQKCEGVVFKNAKKQIYAKYVRNEFKEENAKAFGGNPKYNNEGNNNGDFIFKYCTNPRIDKIIFKLMDEGNKLEMQLMKHLPKRVLFDIWEEHWQDIRDSNWVLDMGDLRRKIPKRCVAVLQQVIVNTGLRDENGNV